jgi:hypothetical protein
MTLEEKRKLYAALAAPFPEQCIQRTEGRVTGRGYDTSGIGYQWIANRLNEVLGLGGFRAHRTVTVKEITRANGRSAFESICDLTLELGTWEDGNFVVFAESLADGGHVAMSEADARKGAYTNAFKKAAAFFGVGRQAYEGTLDDDNVPADGPVEANRSVSHPSPPSPQQRPPANQNGARPSAQPQPARRDGATGRQIGAIWAVGRKAGYDQSSLRALSKAEFGAQVEFLSREQASRFIERLNREAGNGKAHNQESATEPGAEG